MKTIGYLRVSTGHQTVEVQKLAVLDYAQRNGIQIDEYLEVMASSRKSTNERKIDELLTRLERGDKLIVSELSRLGRSVGQVIQIIDALIKEGIYFISVKDNIVINGEHNMQSKIIITMLGLFAELERDLISERTKDGMAKAKAAGKQIGRKRGSLSKSKLDGKEEYIKKAIANGVTKTFLANKYKVSRNNLYHFIRTRGLDQG